MKVSIKFCLKFLSSFCLGLIMFLFDSCNDDESEPTVISVTDMVASVAENSPNGLFLGNLLAETNDNSILSFRITEQTIQNAIRIDSETGQVFINDSSAFNFEALKSISADVEVSANNVTNSGSISVNITDVFEMTDLTGLVAYYPLNGNVNDLVGGEQGITNGTENSANQFEIENQALDFINDGSFIDIGDKNFFVGNNNSFSISIWINPRSFTTANGINRAIISKLSQQTSTFGCNEFHQEFLLDLTSTGAVRVIYYEEDGTGNDRPFRWVNSQELIETNEWSHLYISYNGTLNTNNGKDRVRILINGLESSTNIIQLAGDVPQEIVDTDSHLGIGNMLSSNGNVCIEKSFDGLIDEVAFFSRELSSSEIQSILNLN